MERSQNRAVCQPAKTGGGQGNTGVCCTNRYIISPPVLRNQTTETGAYAPSTNYPSRYNTRALGGTRTCSAVVSNTADGQDSSCHPLLLFRV
jgi:hypothetical protein